jgi:hypothetical protein
VLDMCTTDVYEHYAGQHHGIPLFWPFSGSEHSAVLGLFRAPYVGADLGRVFGSENLTVLVRDTGTALLACGAAVGLARVREARQASLLGAGRACGS